MDRQLEGEPLFDGHDDTNVLNFYTFPGDTFICTYTVRFVSCQCLPEYIFVHKSLSLLLLILHLTFLAVFAWKWLQSCKNEMKQRILLGIELSPTYIVHTLFLSNFIGIAFARTLHYQFYSWYFHTIPLMLCLTNATITMQVFLLVMVEYAFNVFPATPWSSVILQTAHMSILLLLWCMPVPKIQRQNIIYKRD